MPSACFPPSTPGSDPELTDACDALVEFFERLAQLAKSQVMDELAATDLTFSQLRTLFALGAGESPKSVNEIADAVQLSLAAAGRTVDRLVTDGLVDRREDPADRRIKRVSLTATGRELVDGQLTVQRELVQRFVAGLPGGRRAALTEALRSVVDADVDYFDLNRPEITESTDHPTTDTATEETL
ncbi:hypothetical protein GCM10009624_15880 [Gordonia sinesedis]